jgi:pyruvate dehydrogenase complex dehydrogenase (E1) component
MIPDAVAAAEALKNDGIFANVFVITSADVLFHEHLAAARGPAASANALSLRMATLGVTTFGQTGSLEALCRVNRIAPADIMAAAIMAAARTLLD